MLDATARKALTQVDDQPQRHRDHGGTPTRRSPCSPCLCGETQVDDQPRRRGDHGEMSMILHQRPAHAKTRRREGEEAMHVEEAKKDIGFSSRPSRLRVRKEVTRSLV